MTKIIQKSCYIKNDVEFEYVNFKNLSWKVHIVITPWNQKSIENGLKKFSFTSVPGAAKKIKIHANNL